MLEIQATNDVREPEPGMVVRRLIPVGQRLPDDVRRGILALGAMAIPPLLEILGDKELALEKSPGGGWSPSHAARLLGELRAVEAIEPMLRVLAATDGLELLHDQLIQSLPEIGAPIIEPALRAYAENDSRDLRVSIASIIARTGVRDDRIFGVLLEILKTEPSHAAGDLAEYGDERAVPHLSRAFDDYKVVESDSPMANQDLVELRAAIEELGGSLTPAQEAKYGRALEPADRWRRQMHAALQSREPAKQGARPGRNDRCWCGSAKKYKKCHLAADQDAALSPGRRS